MEWILGQFFDNGGAQAIVVRVPRGGGARRLSLTGPGGALDLEALNPGPLEYLRAAIDHDGVPGDDLWRFNLTLQRVRSPGNPLVEEQEHWRGLTVAPDEPGFVAEVLKASALARVVGDVPRARPYVTPGANGFGTVSYVQATGSGQTPAPPSDYDLIGSATDSTGLHALEQIPTVDQVCVLSGAPNADLGPVGVFAAERYCARRNALLLLDPPAHWTSTGEVLRSQRRSVFTSPNALTWFPQLTLPADAGQAHRLRSPVGAIAGVLSRAARPGLDVEPLLFRSRARVALEHDDAEVAQLNSRGVNVLRPVAPGLVAFQGDVTLARRQGVRREWERLSVRRQAVLTAGDIARSTAWAAVQPRSPETWQALTAQLCRYLREATDAGLLQGAGGFTGAFYVKCDQDTNARQSGLRFVVGLALTRPGDYVAFRFEHLAGECRITELAWQPGPQIASNSSLNVPA